MNGFDRLKEEIDGQEDKALIQTVNYLLTRDDLNEKFLNKEKSLEGMAKFIRDKGTKLCKNGWNYITNEVVYAWAVMYYSLPNSFLKIVENKKVQNEKKSTPKAKNNIVSMEDAKKTIDKKKETAQISLFGGATQ